MIRQEQCDKVCRILDDVLANRPTERDSLIVATRKAFEALEETKWIPCSERLPKYEEEVIVSVCDDSGDSTFNYSSCGWYACAGDFWVVDNEPNHYVIAWMPLQEPYIERRKNGR